MSRKCIIHYGIHKTGTSSIQKTFQRNLNDSRFYYLNLNGSGNHSVPIRNAFTDSLTVSSCSRQSSQGLLDDFFKNRDISKSKIINELENANDRTVIISGESVSTMTEDALVEFKKTLSLYFDEIELVGYIRSPVAFMESAFQQIVKGGAATFNLPKLFPNYKSKFSSIENVFGSENVKYWKFDASSFASGCVVSDFCSRIGVELNPDNIIRINEGLSLPAIKLLYVYRKFCPETRVSNNRAYENNVMATALSELKGPKLKFHSDVTGPIIKRNMRSVRWMEERLGDTLEEVVCDTRKSIRSESDLLTIGKIPTRWLSRRLGGKYEAEWSSSLSLVEIAEWMDLYSKLLIPGSR